MSKQKSTVDLVKTTGRIEVTHGIYRIIAGRLADAGQAVAYLGGRRIHTATEASVEAAIVSVSEALDIRMKELRRQRDGEVPSSAEFTEALQALESPSFAALAPLLRAHRYFPEQAASFADLQRVTGQAESSVAALYVKLGKTVSKTLDMAPAEAGLSRKLLPFLVFATIESSVKDYPVLRLRPSFIAALDNILVAPRRSAA